ncbi:MAG: molybdenum cofactor guanylyltransferase, partial [Leptolyngbyaceae bacterium]|nr:molybdenum cofactor guanylyltransferase [Leptolyngbyaceae bacterium]
MLSAIVLAGGQSSRMGQDKALIPVGGVPMIQRVWAIAQQCASPIYVVTPWPERYQPLLPTDCRFVHETPLAGETAAHGPLVGFAQGLAHVQTEWVLLLACDLPQLQVQIFQAWMQQLEDEQNEGAIALLPRH